MIHQVVTRVTLESFRERAEGKKLILLYPWTNYRNLFLSHFLSGREDGLLYYCVAHESPSLQAWLHDMRAQLDVLLGGFGKALTAALGAAEPTPEQLGEALAQDLGQARLKQVTLFIDDLDRLAFDEAFDAFINACVAALPEKVQLAISSRLLTYEPWHRFVDSGQAVVLGTEYRKNDMMFTTADAVKPQVEVYAFGRGHALVNGQEISNWDGALPRNLFFYFVHNQLVTRDDIFQTFWPKLTVKEATNVFHVTKRKISERISIKVKDGENYELTLYSSGFYMPSDKVVRHYDVADFQESVEQAAILTDPAEREKHLRHAIDLYKAPFLETIDMPWVVESREHLQGLYAQALVNMARLKQAQGDRETALGLFTRALREQPSREDVHRNLMTLYAEMDMHDDAILQYRILEQHLKQHLKTEPGQSTRDLLQTIIDQSEKAGAHA